MDTESYGRWYDYSRARDMMLEATDSKHAPWHIVRSDDKRRARLNCISHILSLIPYKKVPRAKVDAGKTVEQGQVRRQSLDQRAQFRRREVSSGVTRCPLIPA